MRRHDALIPLTHDHHHALARARRLRLAAEGDDRAEHLAAAEEFLAFFDEHTLLHFREEEEELFPLVIDLDDAPVELLSRILLEHLQIHKLVRDLRMQVAAGDPSPATIREIAEVLSGHIRAEESQLFPEIERLVAEQELASMHLAPRDREPPPRPDS